MDKQTDACTDGLVHFCSLLLPTWGRGGRGARGRGEGVNRFVDNQPSPFLGFAFGRGRGGGVNRFVVNPRPLSWFSYSNQAKQLPPTQLTIVSINFNNKSNLYRYIQQTFFIFLFYCRTCFSKVRHRRPVLCPSVRALDKTKYLMIIMDNFL